LPTRFRSLGQAHAVRAYAEVEECDAAVDDLVEVKVGEVIEGSVASLHLGPEPRDAAQRLERFDEQVEVRF
jgi:hypothetical protein